MSDDGTPCYRRMSTPTSAEELEEAAGLLRDAAGCIQSAAGRMHYMEAMQFGSVLSWCHQSLSTVSARLGERAERVRDQARREEQFEIVCAGSLWEMSKGAEDGDEVEAERRAR